MLKRFAIFFSTTLLRIEPSIVRETEEFYRKQATDLHSIVHVAMQKLALAIDHHEKEEAFRENCPAAKEAWEQYRITCALGGFNVEH